jgi:hypothetical protein
MMAGIMISCSETPSNPHEIVRKYFTAMQEGDIDKAAELVHPDDVERFRKEFAGDFTGEATESFAEAEFKIIRDSVFDDSTQMMVILRSSWKEGFENDNRAYLRKEDGQWYPDLFRIPDYYQDYYDPTQAPATEKTEE